MPATPNSKVNLAGSGALLHVQNPSGDFVPVQGDADGFLLTTATDSGTPARTPLAATLVLTGAAVQLSTALPDGAETSQAAWRIVVPSGGAGVLWGPQGSEVIPIDAGNFDTIPSATLAGWWAKSAGANVTISLVGAQDV